MTRLSAPRGMTLLEVMVSMALLGIALLGLASSHIVASTSLSQAKRQTEGAALAQQLAATLETIPYTSNGTSPTGLFANTATSNDADVGDSTGNIDAAGVLDPVAAGLADHADTELPAGVLASLSPANATIPNSTIAVYQRYWNISPIVDPLTPTAVGGVTIAVIVRWPLTQNGGGNGGYGHVAVLTTRFDPQLMRQ